MQISLVRFVYLARDYWSLGRLETKDDQKRKSSKNKRNDETKKLLKMAKLISVSFPTSFIITGLEMKIKMRNLWFFFEEIRQLA